MGRISRRALARGAVFAVLATAGALVGGAAFAAPTPTPPTSPRSGPTAISIEGAELDEPLTLTLADRPREFEAMLSEVDWLYARLTVATKSPSPDKLGPKYTITVLHGEAAKQTYDLYPLAVGGPRAYRPAKQPDRRKVTAGWFYGRLTMPVAMRAAGVPLAGVSVPPGMGGAGGGTGTGDAQNLNSMFGQWRGVVALNGVIALLIAGGMFFLAFGVRRKV